MADYYVSSSNLTFSLYEDRIMYNEGSGSVYTKHECTKNWFSNQSDINIIDMLEISNQVSGSNTYMKDRGWM